MNKKNYVSPQIEIVRIRPEDVMQTGNVSQGKVGMTNFVNGGNLSKKHINQLEEEEYYSDEITDVLNNNNVWE